MAVTVDQIVEISVNGVASGQAINNVFHYKPVTLNPNFVTTLQQCLEAFRTMWRNTVLGGLSTSYAVLRYKGRALIGTRVDPANPNNIILNIGDVGDLTGDPITDLGGTAGAALPTYTAMTLRKLSGVGGKRKKGSCRLGPIPESYTEAADQNKLTAAATAVGLVAAGGLKGTLGPVVVGDTLVPVIMSRASLFPTPPAVQPNMTGKWIGISDILLNPYVGSQVSRKQRSTFGG